MRPQGSYAALLPSPGLIALWRVVGLSATTPITIKPGVTFLGYTS